MHRLLAPVALAMVIALGGCQDMTRAAAPIPVHGYVTDMKAFDAFIAMHPTPDQFHAAYPDVLLVLPGTVTTLELRMNNSRYYAELDKDGHIVGGHFS
jgi:hypothetical protein